MAKSEPPTATCESPSPAAPVGSHWRSGEFWAWFLILSVLIRYAIAALIFIFVPDNGSVLLAIALNISNIVVSLCAGCAIARRKYRNDAQRVRDRADGGPGAV